LTQEHAARLGCTPTQLKAMKRDLLAAGFARDPALHFGLAARVFARAVVGSYYVAHVSHVLALRKWSWVAHSDERSYLQPHEVQLLDEYTKLGFPVGARSGSVLLLSSDVVGKVGEWVLRILSGALLLASAAIAYRRGRLRELLLDAGNLGMLLFLTAYSLALSLSAVPSVYDRYTLVNLLVLCLLAARVSAMTLGRAAMAKSPS
jgi:hypothetical protein